MYWSYCVQPGLKKKSPRFRLHLFFRIYHWGQTFDSFASYFQVRGSSIWVMLPSSLNAQETVFSTKALPAADGKKHAFSSTPDSTSYRHSSYTGLCMVSSSWDRLSEPSIVRVESIASILASPKSYSSVQLLSVRKRGVLQKWGQATSHWSAANGLRKPRVGTSLFLLTRGCRSRTCRGGRLPRHIQKVSSPRRDPPLASAWKIHSQWLSRCLFP